jgi:hypothetical protein
MKVKVPKPGLLPRRNAPSGSAQRRAAAAGGASRARAGVEDGYGATDADRDLASREPKCARQPASVGRLRCG